MISLDLDSPSVFEVTRAWFYLSRRGLVQGRVSSSGNGIHIKCFKHGLSEREIETIRMKLGGDTRRIEMDRNSDYKFDQIMFTSKENLETNRWETAGPWYKDLYDLVSNYQFRAREIA